MTPLLLQAFEFVLPCWLINAGLNIFYFAKCEIPPFAKLDHPLDLGHNFIDNARWLGQSTTWLGLPIALASGAIIETALTGSATNGLIKGAAVYAGHAAGSFIKRRLGLDRGQFLPLIDHGDSVIVAATIFLSLNFISWPVAAIALGMTYLAIPIAIRLAYSLKIRDMPF